MEVAAALAVALGAALDVAPAKAVAIKAAATKPVERVAAEAVVVTWRTWRLKAHVARPLGTWKSHFTNS